MSAANPITFDESSGHKRKRFNDDIVIIEDTMTNETVEDKEAIEMDVGAPVTNVYLQELRRDLLEWENIAVNEMLEWLPCQTDELLLLVIRTVRQYGADNPDEEDAQAIVRECLPLLMENPQFTNVTTRAAASQASSSSSRAAVGTSPSASSSSSSASPVIVVDDSRLTQTSSSSTDSKFEVAFVSMPSRESSRASLSSKLKPGPLLAAAPLTPLQAILDVFPNACDDGVKALLKTYKDNIEATIQHMAENGFEKRKDKEKVTKVEHDFASSSWQTSLDYRAQAMLLLQRDYPFIRVVNLRNLFEHCKSHYWHTLEKLQADTGVLPGQITFANGGFNTVRHASIATALKNCGLQHKQVARTIFSMDSITDSTLLEELSWIKQRKVDQRMKEDQLLAEKLNTEIAMEEGALIECGCCCEETPFESNVQCSEGHLFCKNCLQRYAEQTVFGDGRSQLKCMNTGDGCPGFFPYSMLQACLSNKVLEKFNEAQARDAIKAAAINLVTCFNCQLQAELPEDAGVLLSCPSCGKQTCRNCGEEGHVPLKCSEIEKKAQATARLTVEEAMTAARLRECKKCHAKFFKVEGCNKMTCACGALICYLCRKDISVEKYKHFCSTPHCTHATCGMCVLFTDSVTDDRRAMYEAGLTALQQQAGDKDKDTIATVAINNLIEGGVPVPKKATTAAPAPLQMPLPLPLPPPPFHLPGLGNLPIPMPPVYNPALPNVMPNMFGVMQGRNRRRRRR